MKMLVLVLLVFIISTRTGHTETYPLKNILILVEGEYDLKSKATAHGRELAQLMGHFNTAVTLEGTNHYKTGEPELYDFTFYIGSSGNNRPPDAFCRDLIKTTKPVIWLNGGYSEFCHYAGNDNKFGFITSGYTWTSDFNMVKARGHNFKKGTGEISRIQIGDNSKVEILATVFSTKTRTEWPYIVKSGNLFYVADLPFLGAETGDRYIFFADMLHDILDEKHAEVHQAIIRIEDVTPLHDPDKLRQIADMLSERGIPFLVGVVPVYINPGENQKVYLSERPEMVDALKYMVQNGGTIVMHGTTHQYRGVSTDDCEFWDSENECPIPGENPDQFAEKIKTGIDEFTRNGLYPVVWETPHYEGSVTFYGVISRFFGSAVEQRMVINDFDYGQYFPYIINKDIYHQKIYPENLGYVPLSPDIEVSRAAVRQMIRGAADMLQVRDGIASGFFHPFLNLDLLKTLVDGITALGFTFMDIRDSTNWVKTDDKVILTGTQSFTLNAGNHYLHENYFNRDNKLIAKSFSDNRIKGMVTKTITLKPDETYFAEAIDYHVREVTFRERLTGRLSSVYHSISRDRDWQPIRVKVYWNSSAKGGAYFDQCSFISVFSHLNVQVDTVFSDAPSALSDCNLLVVPFSAANLLTEKSISDIRHFIENGGNLITDSKNELIQALGFTFSETRMKVHNIRDKFYPEEVISWKVPQLVSELDYEADDEILCTEPSENLPVVIGRQFKEGKIIYLNTPFDPLGPDSYSYYPYLTDHIRRYFNLRPVVKRENLEMYFDPGYRRNISEETLVKDWVKYGVRIIHVAGWHQYPRYTYDYAHLIKLAHANGILVYAWIEPPQVSQKFWNEHPEWREKNYLGQDIHHNDTLAASWRYPVALTDKDCFDAARKEYLKLLNENDFDGVNVGELNFDAGKGFAQPQLFTPMHPSALKEFRTLYGFGLREIFRPGSAHFWKNNPVARKQVTAYRTAKVREFNDTLLSDFSRVARLKPGFEMILTFYDSFFSPEMTEYHGVDANDMLFLQEKYNCCIQPEDPADKWSTNPDRYEEMGKAYAARMKDPSKLMLDLNILHFREKDEITPFPTLIQTGSESIQLLHAASRGAPRFTVYSESSCNPQDLWFFPYASAGMVSYRFIADGLEVNSPCSFILQFPQDVKTISIDKVHHAGYRENRFIIPAGQHVIKTHMNEIPGFSTDKFQPELLSFTGNLLKISSDMWKTRFQYESAGRTLASLNYEPATVLVDGNPGKAEILKGNDCFTLFLPAGKHSVEVIIGDAFSHDINLASLLSMEAIAVYGFIAVALLTVLFFVLKFVRKRYER